MRQKDVNTVAQVIGNNVRIDKDCVFGEWGEGYLDGCRDALGSIINNAKEGNDDIDKEQAYLHFEVALRSGFGVLAQPGEIIDAELIAYYEGAHLSERSVAIQDSVNAMFRHLDELEITEPCS